MICRSPTIYQSENRSNWIESIKKHQQINEHQNYYICRRHFHENCFKANTKKVELVCDAVPTIFDSPDTDQQVLPVEIQHDSNQNACQSQGNINLEIDLLQKEILRIRAQNDAEKQALQMKIDSLSDKCGELSCNNIQLKKKCQENNKEKKIMIDTISKLQNQLNPSAQNEILTCFRNGVNAKEKYSEVVRAFCFKLHCYSPRGYEYVRSVFNKNLPHATTIKAWYRNSNIDTEPGINQSSLKILEKMALEMRKNNQELVCTLMFDEMSIRKHIQWCSKTKKFLGYVTYGDNKNEIANYAIVFLVNGVNAKIQVPVAYHFITSLDAKNRKTILLEILAELFKYGITVSNITFDGLPANFAMCRLLGASFTRDDMRTFFMDPHSKRKIYIISDPSHCIKLVRNNLFSRKSFVDSNGDNIQWHFIKSLVEYGKKNDFGLTHKLTNRHINFKNRKMHVGTAVQTFSNSAADSLAFLMAQNIRGFSNAEATIKFIRTFNYIFDIFNTHKVDHNQTNHFKSAVNFFNSEEVFNFLNDAKEYIYGLKCAAKGSRRMVPIVRSVIRTGFLGFLINIESLMNMYRELVQEQELMHTIACYNLSQDHVEMFFSKIRSVHRSNDNPTVQQFKASYKRIQMASDISISQNANISSVIPAVSNLLTISSVQKTDFSIAATSESAELFDGDESVEEIGENFHFVSEDMCHDGAVSFVAFEIEVRLLKAAGCSYCKMVIRQNDKVEEINCVGNNIPCQSTFDICKAVDAAIKQLINSSNNDFKHKITSYVMRTINFDELYPNYFDEHHDSDHKHYLVNYIINEYTHIKCTFISKQKNLEMHKNYFRCKYRKEIQRAGQ